MSDTKPVGATQHLRRLIPAAILVSAALYLALTAMVVSLFPVIQPPTEPRLNRVASVVTTTAMLTDLQPASLTAVAQPGDGVIRVYARACGFYPTLGQWQATAAANGIRPPVYLVLLGQRLTVDCAARPVAVALPPAPAPQPAPQPAAASSGWVNPLPGACLGSPYHQKRVNAQGQVYYHEGWDLPAAGGTPIRAAGAGTVVHAGWAGGGGNTVVVYHGSAGVWTVYMHMSRIDIWKGAWVRAGQQIGRVGTTGASSGNHLHFEVNQSGPFSNETDPRAFLANRGVRLGC